MHFFCFPLIWLNRKVRCPMSASNGQGQRVEPSVIWVFDAFWKCLTMDLSMQFARHIRKPILLRSQIFQRHNALVHCMSCFSTSSMTRVPYVTRIILCTTNWLCIACDHFCIVACFSMIYESSHSAYSVVIKTLRLVVSVLLEHCRRRLVTSHLSATISL